MQHHSTARTALIPRRALFGNPDHSMVRISPDGSHLSWQAPLDGVMNVWVAPRNNPGGARPVTADTGRGIRMHYWAFTNQHLLYVQDKNGDENWRIYAVDLATGNVRDLTPFEDVNARIESVSDQFPSEIVVGLNNRDAKWHDTYRINVASGEMTLLLRNDRFSSVTIDRDYRVAIVSELTSDGGARYLVPNEGGDEWRVWMEVSPEDMFTTGPIDFAKDNRILFMKDSRGRDTAALTSIDLHTKQSQLLAADEKCDAGEVIVHPSQHHLQAVSFVYERKRWQILDQTIAADMAYLNSVADGEITVSSRSLDDRFWVIVYLVDDGPVRYYLYSREQRQAEFLFTNRKELENLPLAKMQPIVIRSRDGLDLVGYYTLPLGSDTDSDGVPDRPLPMVFTPHGGPWHRDSWGFHAWHQWLSNRGYAVLAVNFRASTGFGKAFTNAGDREWGGKILNDQVDAVQWAIGAGIADPKLVAIMGGSFGGYSTLAGLTFTPELFACGVDLVGVANLMTWITSIPAYWKPMLDLVKTRVGDPDTDVGKALLKKHSPLTYVDRICRPLLIAQGANDPRVRQAESDHIVESMKAAGIPVTYLLYPDEGHGFARPENSLSFCAVAEAFLASCIGGDCEPIGLDFENSSLQVLEGVEHVADLEQAMAAK